MKILSLTRNQLREAVRALIVEVDYDISKEYDPEYKGREDDEHPTFDDVADDTWRHLIELGAVEATTPD